MKFSIILPIYKVEKYLRSCLNSILNQTYKDFEVILVDDGSPDSCPQICDDYSQRDNRVKVIHKKNGGQADARNVGLEAAVGDYICYVDSDDYFIDENVLQLLADKTKGNPDIVHYKNIEWLESDGSILPCPYSFDVPTEERTIVEIYCDLIDRDAYYNSAWSKIIRRKLLMDNNIRFEKGIVGEDNEWYYHVVMVAESLVLLDEPLYVYRRRSGSTTTSLSKKNLKDQLYVIEKWVNQLNKYSENPAAKVIYGSLAKQYCSAIIIAASIDQSKDCLKNIKEYAFLLNFTKTKRVVIFRYLVRILGVKTTIQLLKLYNKIKK